MVAQQIMTGSETLESRESHTRRINNHCKSSARKVKKEKKEQELDGVLLVTTVMP